MSNLIAGVKVEAAGTAADSVFLLKIEAVGAAVIVAEDVAEVDDCVCRGDGPSLAVGEEGAEDDGMAEEVETVAS